MELTWHLEALVDQPSKDRELSFVELAHIEPMDLSVKHEAVVHLRNEAKREVQEGANSPPPLQEVVQRYVRAALCRAGVMWGTSAPMGQTKFVKQLWALLIRCSPTCSIIIEPRRK